MFDNLSTLITRINFTLIPLFILYVILRRRLVYTMLTNKITSMQTAGIIGFTLLAVEGIHWSNQFNDLNDGMLMSTAVMRLSILIGMLFGRFTGTAIGFLSGALVLLHEQHILAVKLAVLALATLGGFLAGQYKDRYGAVWEKSNMALMVATILFAGAILVADLVLVNSEPGVGLADPVAISIWRVTGFCLSFYLIQLLIAERHNINSYDVLAGEMLFARRLQMDIVAHKAEGFIDKRACVFGALHPAKDVGGDWYDYFMLGEDKLCLVIGDVSGKGVPAALFMVVGCMLFRAFKADAGKTDPAEILEWVNNDLCEDNKSKMFITAVCAILNLKTGELVYSNVGHTKAYIKKMDGAIVALPVTNKGALGFFRNKRYTNSTVKLQPHDVFLTYTDGVTEAQNTNTALFGSERLEKLLSGRRGTVESLCETIIMAVNDFSAGNEQSDDITLLAVEYGKIGLQE